MSPSWCHPPHEVGNTDTVSGGSALPTDRVGFFRRGTPVNMYM